MRGGFHLLLDGYEFWEFILPLRTEIEVVEFRVMASWRWGVWCVE